MKKQECLLEFGYNPEFQLREGLCCDCEYDDGRCKFKLEGFPNDKKI